MRVHLCGVRGSTPAVGIEFVRYGGHTPCLALAHEDSTSDSASTSAATATPPTLILDAGTGLQSVSALLGGAPFAGTIVLSHLHWDHTLGLPFFAAGDDPRARVSVLLPEQDGGAEQDRGANGGAEQHGGTEHSGSAEQRGGAEHGGRTEHSGGTEQRGGADATSLLAGMMRPPYFPIEPTELRGAWEFATIAPGELRVEGFEVLAREIPHKGGRTFGYRISDGHSTLTYMPDHCPTALGPGEDGWGEYHPAAIELARDADVLVHDAQLLPQELAAEASYGHAVADYCVELGRRASARSVVLFHHRHDRTDGALDELARRLGDGSRSPTVSVAAEGTVLEL